MGNLAIETSGLEKRYPTVRAVDGLNLSVPRGAVYGFLGRNGAGKTTTMKMLLGLARPSGGSARVLDYDIRTQRVEILEHTAFTGERKVLYDNLTPAELIYFNSGFYPNWSNDAAQKYARMLEIPLKQPLAKLSHGNRTKVCLLLALAQNAELLILDEPTIGLDPVMIDDILRILVEDHAAEGRTIFFSSHQLAEVEQIADWVGIIEAGKVLMEARLEDIRGEFRIVTASGNNLPMDGPQVISATESGRITRYVVSRDAEAFCAELEGQGATVLDVIPLTLREVFLELVRKEGACIPGNAGATPVAVS